MSIIPCELTRTVSPSNSIWRDERVFPAYIAAISALSLLVHGIVTSQIVQRLRAKWSLKNGTELDASVDEDVVTAEPTTRWERAKHRGKVVGGPAVFAFKLIRLAVVVALCIVTIVSVVRTSWAWYNIALVATVVRFLMHSPFTPIRQAKCMYTGVLCTARSSQRVRSCRHKPDLFVTPHYGSARRLCHVRISRHMASDDVLPPSS